MSILLNIPIDSEQIAPWLEQQLTGMHLGLLVAELETVHGSSERKTLAQICGAELDQICESGLSCLSSKAVTQLLINPNALLELQDAVFVDGSAYWQQLASAGESGRRAKHLQKVALEKLLPGGHSTWVPATEKTNPDHGSSPPVSIPASSKQAATTTSGSTAPVPVRTGISRSTFATPVPAADVKAMSSGRRRVRWFLGSGTIAALLLVMVLQWPSSPKPGWGFNTPDLLAFEGSEKQFLNHLADAANQWSSKQPADTVQLRERLVQFGNGCQKLIDTLDEPLPQLSPETQTWLRDKCLAWKTTIDEHVAAIDNGTGSFPEIRAAADATISKLVKALRNGPDTTA